ncbi:MFS transporter [Actinoplanes sp. NPDC026619]|uniref:MFS transporter n=1 Tax=Actinoplanes sp. NPDC026619 TaxID=3155798 RepID=UPI0033D0DCBB
MSRRWIAVAGVFLVLAAGTGVGFYATSAYVAALTGDRGFGLSLASSGPALSFVCAGLGGLLAARLLPRLGVRVLLPAGAAGTAAGLLLLGRTGSAWSLWLSFGLSGGVGALMAVVPCTSLITRWFAPDPAKALTIATTGMSAGGAVVPPFVVLLIERQGLATATVWLAVAVFGVVALVAAVIREPARPAQAVARVAAPVIPDPGRFTFPLLGAGFGLLMLSQVGAVAHVLTIAADRNIHGGALALTALAAASVGARLLGIPMLAGLGLLRFSCVVAAVQAAAMALLAVADDLRTLIAATALLGVTVGNAVVLMPLHMLTAFGMARFDRSYARLNVVSTIGTAGGPVVLGLMHDAFGGYRPALGVLAAGSGTAVALLLIARIDTTRRWRRPQRTSVS